MKNEKYERITGQELPKKTPTNKTFKEITLDEFRQLEKNFDGFGWGRVVNKGCEIYRTKDGREIEIYEPCPGGMKSYFIEQ